VFQTFAISWLVFAMAGLGLAASARVKPGESDEAAADDGANQRETAAFS
jgi:hypothetical protein